MTVDTMDKSTFRSGFVFATALTVLFPSYGTAQDALFDPQALKTACSQDACGEVTEDLLLGLQAQGLSGDALNSQVGLIAALVLASGRDNPGRNVDDIAQSLLALSSLSTDTAQRAGIENAAGAITRGDLTLLRTGEPFAVSPDRSRRRRPFRRPNWPWLRFFGV